VEVDSGYMPAFVTLSREAQFQLATATKYVQQSGNLMHLAQNII
jgi:hypothetical protein